jgi:hypothetical protein
LKKYFILTFLILSGFIGKFVSAQDVHFSQYYAAPLSMNAACTGFYSGDWRAMGIYRSQWKSVSVPYITQAFAFDHQWYIHTENLS